MEKFSINKAEITDVLKNIIRELGIEVLDKEEILRAAVGDFLPISSNEYKIIVIAVRAGVGSYFYRVSQQIDQNRAAKELTQDVTAINNILTEKCGFNKELVISIIEAFVEALNIDKTIFKEIIENNVIPVNLSRNERIGKFLNNLRMALFSRYAILFLFIMLISFGFYYYFLFPRGKVFLIINNTNVAEAHLVIKNKLIHTANISDGKLYMRVPLNKEFTIKVSANGFMDKSKKLILSSVLPESKLQFDMVRKPVNLDVLIVNKDLHSSANVKVQYGNVVFPGSAKFKTKNKFRFKVPIEKPLKLIVSASGYLDYRENLVINQNETNRVVKVNLQPSKGTIVVDLLGEELFKYTPTVCLIQNGKRISSQSFVNNHAVKFEVDFDKNYTVKVISNSHNVSSKTVKVSLAKPQHEIMFNMILSPRLEVKTNAKAMVFLDNNFIGEANENGMLIFRNSNLFIKNKTYKITCKLDGFNSKSSTIKVVDGDDNRVSIILSKIQNSDIENNDNMILMNEYEKRTVATDKNISDWDDNYSERNSSQLFDEEHLKNLEAVSTFETNIRRAEQGDSSAQLQVGVFYASGKGVEQNYFEAVKWLRRAAEQGNSEAQYLLSDCYYNGRGTDKNLDEAKKWCTLSANSGNMKARETLKENGWE